MIAVILLVIAPTIVTIEIYVTIQYIYNVHLLETLEIAVFRKRYIYIKPLHKLMLYVFMRKYKINTYKSLNFFIIKSYY